MTPEQLQPLFAEAFTSAIGPAQDHFARQAFVRMLARKLAAHFDVVGWPETQEEILVYVREATQRYG